jgi:hypothetical protein
MALIVAGGVVLSSQQSYPWHGLEEMVSQAWASAPLDDGVAPYQGIGHAIV